MIPERRRRKDDEDVDAWLMTFADMATLLLCFFIIMFSMSSPDTTQFKKVAEALRKEGFYSSAIPTQDPYENLKTQLSLALGASGYGDFMAVSSKENQIEVELSATSFFDAGSAKFTKDALPMLRAMVSQLEAVKDEDVVIEVEGHTDDTPPGKEFPSNWELSTARASNVVRYLIAKGFSPYKLKVTGYGSSQPKAPNRDSTGTPIPSNQELNRRVVVKLVKPD